MSTTSAVVPSPVTDEELSERKQQLATQRESIAATEATLDHIAQYSADIRGYILRDLHPLAVQAMTPPDIQPVQIVKSASASDEPLKVVYWRQ